MRPIRLLAAIALAVVVLTSGGAAQAAGAAQAQGFESIHDYAVTITINDDGTLSIKEVIQYDFGVVPQHGIFRDIPVRFDYPKKKNTDRVYELDDISVAASEGTPAQFETEDFTDNGVGYERIKIGDPDTTITGNHTYEIRYRVKGALNAFEDHDELYWNAIGQQWAVTIDRGTVRVDAADHDHAGRLLPGFDGFDASVRRRRPRTDRRPSSRRTSSSRSMASRSSSRSRKARSRPRSRSSSSAGRSGARSRSTRRPEERPPLCSPCSSAGSGLLFYRRAPRPQVQGFSRRPGLLERDG